MSQPVKSGVCELWIDERQLSTASREEIEVRDVLELLYPPYGDRESDRGGSPRMIYESSTCWLRVSEGRQHSRAGQGRAGQTMTRQG